MYRVYGVCGALPDVLAQALCLCGLLVADVQCQPVLRLRILGADGGRWAAIKESLPASELPKSIDVDRVSRLVETRAETVGGRT